MAIPVALWRPEEEKAYARDLMTRIVNECPRRQPTSPDERRAHEILGAEFQKVGLALSEHAFTFNDNLYANLALHFGLGTLGTVVSQVAPAAGFLMHLAAGGSYYLESTRKAYLLRRLFPWKPSRNVLGTLPATGEPELRVVILSHVDAAFTGWLFDPKFIKAFAGKPPLGIDYLTRSLAMATHAQFALAGIDLLKMVTGPLSWPLRPLEWALTAPSLIAFLVNLQVVLKNEIVPGAADNLTACVAQPLLARRLAAKKPANVEIVFAAMGCEEASLGGGDAMARDFEGRWDPKKTVILGLDTLSNGDLRFLEWEGEVRRLHAPEWLCEVARGVAASEPRFAEVTGFAVPVGGSDVAAFLAHGWDGLCLTCIDPTIGAPRHYHWPTDTPENVDYDKFMLSLDFAEDMVDAIIAKRLS
jgi:hypothetical protein